MIGRNLGNYRIVEQIGLGGMATVFKGYDPDTERYVAVKVLPQHFSNDPQFRERFKREAKAIAKLEHLHILPIFAYGEEDGIAYMAMRYLEAGTLSDHIGRGPLPFNEASRLLTQLAGALDHAHANGVLHRDMKPSNVLLDDAGNAYLMDFGIAKMVEATVDLTGDRMLGTPAYMSPEQCKGEKQLTPATDIYSLGIILYEMVTGKRPFHAETPIAVILQQLNDPLPLPHELRPDLSPAAEGVMLKALAKDPESRYRTAGEFAAAFAQAVAMSRTTMGGPPPSLSPVLETRAAQTPPVKMVDEDVTTAVPPARQLPGWLWGVLGLVLIAAVFWGASLITDWFGEETAVQPATVLAFVDSGLAFGGVSDDEAALVDVDDDGDLDVLVANELWLNQDGDFLRVMGMPELSGHVRAMALSDLNDDGYLDIFYGRAGGYGGSLVWLNDGNGRFYDTGQLLGPDDNWSVTAGDVDDDGDVDLFASGDEVHVWLNDGSGTFDSGISWPADNGFRAVALVDLNDDGYLDLFTANCAIWINNGNGIFAQSSSPTCDSNNVAMALGDLDDDGDVDAFIGNATRHPNLVWLNDGNGRFTNSTQQLGDSSTEAVALLDIDQDGDLDAAIGNTNELDSDNRDQIWLNDGNGRFTLSAITLGVGNTHHIVSGDLNDDGIDDLLISGPDGSHIWFNESQ